MGVKEIDQSCSILKEFKIKLALKLIELYRRYIRSSDSLAALKLLVAYILSFALRKFYLINKRTEMTPRFVAGYN